MSADLVPQTCDECGRQMAKAHRIHKGHRYCAACYPQVFKRRQCPRCGNFARLPKNDLAALCRKCETDMPCVRCGKVDYAIGKITVYGPVCNSCSPHFRTPEPCEVCGALSPRRTRVSRLGHEYRVCPRCAGDDQGTCQACTRHRPLREAENGRMLCKTCLEKGEVPCPKCREPMPAGYGKQCRPCYWKALLEKRIRIDCAAFSSPSMALHFKAFGEWLGEEVGKNKAAITVYRYLPFFMEVERQWRSIPKYTVLLAYFGTAKLRRVLLPMRWMEAIGLVQPSDNAKADNSERRRLSATLGKFANGSQEQKLLVGYYQALVENMEAKKVTLRSVRLALSPAAALLRTTNQRGGILPDQRRLDAYLAKTPGQRAGVSGFVRYLREAHGAEITLPKVDPERTRRQRRKRLELELLTLMREGGVSDEFKRRWLSVALVYFHGLPKRVVSTNWKNLLHRCENGDGVVFQWKGFDYWLPSEPLYLPNLPINQSN